MHENNNESTDALDAEADSVDKIRDILFGNQMRDFEHKFRQLQDEINKELNDLKSDSKMRIDALESFVKSEFESLNKRLDSEQKLRTSELQENSDKLETRVKVLESKLQEQENRNNEQSRELRQLLLQQSKDILEKMSQKQLEDKEQLNRVKSDLNSEKVDRSVLSNLLTELALQITGAEHMDAKSSKQDK